MITVHVWESAWSRYLPGGGEGSPGHAAIEIGATYVSYWPGQSNGVLKWKGYKLHTKGEDLDYYTRSKQVHWTQELPTSSGSRAGLDEAAMLRRWKEIQESSPDYSTTFQCSTVVNELLIAGGSRRYLMNTPWNLSTWVLFAVSPADVKNYVIDLARAIERAKA